MLEQVEDTEGAEKHRYLLPVRFLQPEYEEEPREKK